jgi:hypothetical protein
MEFEIARGLKGLGGIRKCYLKFTKYETNEKK